MKTIFNIKQTPFDQFWPDQVLSSLFNKQPLALYIVSYFFYMLTCLPSHSVSDEETGLFMIHSTGAKGRNLSGDFGGLLPSIESLPSGRNYITYTNAEGAHISHVYLSI